MLYRLLRTYLRPYRRDLIAVVILQFVQAIAALALPAINAEVIDKGIRDGDHGLIWSKGGEMLLLSLLQVFCSIAAVWFGARIAMAMGRDMRAALFRRVGEFSTREVDHFGPPSLITRITNDVQQVQLLVQMVCTLLIAAPITAIGGTIMALREDVPLTVVLGVALPLMLIFLALVIRRMMPLFRQMQDRIDNVNRVLREQLMGIRVIRAFVREPLEEWRFGVANRDLTEVSLSSGRLMAVMFPVVMFIVNAASAWVVWLGGKRIASGELQIGQLVAFLTYLVLILMSAMFATFIAVLWPRSAVCGERIVEVLDTSPSVTAPSSPVTPTQRATVRFDDVTFNYPGAEVPVLSNMSFEASAGQTLAIIGSTGAGKTTMLGLIARLFDVTTGSVQVDGVNVRQLDPQVLWSRLGMVPQRPYLFSGTVASNLRYANPEATDAELWAALDIAQATEFVTAMPGGLDAAVEQGGTNLSGGQRQRLAIARAIVRRPEIYLFDDSFSALDLATDARLRAALKPETREACVIVVAQRVSTILDADQILVIEDGEIIGRGRHEELIDSCPTYLEIVNSQLQVTESER